MNKPPQGYIQVGRACLGWPGDVWVAPELLAQKGESEVRQMVRDIYASAYRYKDRERERHKVVQGGAK